MKIGFKIVGGVEHRHWVVVDVSLGLESLKVLQTCKHIKVRIQQQEAGNNSNMRRHGGAEETHAPPFVIVWNPDSYDLAPAGACVTRIGARSFHTTVKTRTCDFAMRYGLGGAFGQWCQRYAMQGVVRRNHR